MDKLRDKMSDKLKRGATSATGALAAVLMIGAITFGATVIRPMTADRNSDAATASTDDGFAPGLELANGGEDGDGANGGGNAGQCEDEQGNSIPCDEEVPPWEPPVEEPAEEPPAEEPAEEPKEEPKDEPTDEPDPAPSSDLALEAFLNENGKITVEWSAFTGDFEKYKLVRSTDAEASWPEGDGDELVAVTGPGDEHFTDKHAPCNVELHYRAFAVRHGDDGYVVLASSNVGAATRECVEVPPAEPKALAFELALTAEGVELSWESCPSEDFAVYKVVRSATDPDPMYPLHDGDELIGVIGDSGETHFVDSNVEVGQTWTYRVLSMASGDGGWVVIGLTDALTITVE